MEANRAERPQVLDGQAAGYAKGRARQRAIIATATETFAQYGFTSATIRDIAAACGISRAGLLHYFPSKTELLMAVLAERDRDDQLRFWPEQDGSDAVEGLVGIVALVQHNTSVPGLVQLFVRLAAEAHLPDHPAHEFFLRRSARVKSELASALDAVAANGELAAEGSVDDLAVRLAALLDGLQAAWLLDPEIHMARHIAAAIEGILTEPGKLHFRAALLSAGKDTELPPSGSLSSS